MKSFFTKSQMLICFLSLLCIKGFPQTPLDPGTDPLDSTHRIEQTKPSDNGHPGSSDNENKALVKYPAKRIAITSFYSMLRPSKESNNVEDKKNEKTSSH